MLKMEGQGVVEEEWWTIDAHSACVVIVIAMCQRSDFRRSYEDSAESFVVRSDWEEVYPLHDYEKLETRSPGLTSGVLPMYFSRPEFFGRRSCDWHFSTFQRSTFGTIQLFWKYKDVEWFTSTAFLSLSSYFWRTHDRVLFWSVLIQALGDWLVFRSIPIHSHSIRAKSKLEKEEKGLNNTDLARFLC